MLNTYSQAELDKILRKHKLWLNKDPNGVRANLEGASLEGASLSGTNLERANLAEAKLLGVNLAEAKLKEVNLIGIKIETKVWLSEDNYEDFVQQTDLEEFFVYRFNEYYIVLETRPTELNKVFSQNMEILYIRRKEQ